MNSRRAAAYKVSDDHVSPPSNINTDSTVVASESSEDRPRPVKTAAAAEDLHEAATSGTRDGGVLFNSDSPLAKAGEKMASFTTSLSMRNDRAMKDKAKWLEEEKVVQAALQDNAKQ